MWLNKGNGGYMWRLPNSLKVELLGHRGRVREEDNGKVKEKGKKTKGEVWMSSKPIKDDEATWEG